MPIPPGETPRLYGRRDACAVAVPRGARRIPGDVENWLAFQAKKVQKFSFTALAMRRSV